MKISKEARDARVPPPPEDLVGALHGQIHVPSGRSRPAKSVKSHRLPITTSKSIEEIIADSYSVGIRLFYLDKFVEAGFDREHVLDTFHKLADDSEGLTQLKTLIRCDNGHPVWGGPITQVPPGPIMLCEYCCEQFDVGELELFIELQ